MLDHNFSFTVLSGLANKTLHLLVHVHVHVTSENVVHVQHLSHTLQMLSACFSLCVEVENRHFIITVPVHKQAYLPNL